MSRKTAESRNMLCPEANATQNGGRQNSCQKRTQSCGSGNRREQESTSGTAKVGTKWKQDSKRRTREATKWEENGKTSIHNVRPEKQQSGTKVEQNGPEDPWIRPKVGTQSWPWKVYILPIYTIPIMSFFIQDCKYRYLIVTTRWTLHLQVLAPCAIGSHTPT